MDLIITSLLVAIVNNVFGVPGLGVPSAVLVVVWLAYVTVPEALFGATLGKMLTGVCVVDLHGAPLSLRQIALRNLGRFIDALPVLYIVGGVLVLATARSQRIGDLLGGTTVVARVHAAGPTDTRRPPRGAGRALAATVVALTIFTLAFNYFGRPPLVVEGAYRSGALQLDSYSLGAARWSLGHITYPLTGTKGGSPCTGEAYLDWTPAGWDVSGWSEVCVPGSKG